MNIENHNLTPEIKGRTISWIRGALLGMIGITVLLLLAVGNMELLWGWVYIAMSTLSMIAHVIILVPINPAFLADRAGGLRQLAINWNPVTETWANLKIAHGNAAVFNSIVGLSWLWFFGSIFLTSFAPYALGALGGAEGVVTFLLAVFSVGIGIGSLACEKLSRRRVEIGLVPLGSIGMTVFAIDLYFASVAFAPMDNGTLAQFLAAPGSWRIVTDLALLSL